MKIQLLLLSIFLTPVSSLFSQTSDHQWLISNNSGKTGATYGYTMTANFSTEGVALPSRLINDARNDLFIIYADGSHFNTRGSSPTSQLSTFVMGNGTVGDTHNFNSSSGIIPSYMYLTNIYESDDLPDDVRIAGTNSNANSTPYPLGTTTAPIISANHDIALTKDITLIINLAAIKNQYPLQQHSKTYDIRLLYDGIEQISHLFHHPVDYENNILDTSSVFSIPSGGKSAVQPSTALAQDNNEELRIADVQDTYVYVNLRPNTNAVSYTPTIDQDTFKVVFRLKVNGTIIPEELREPILHSHDPNFLRVDSIVKADDGGYTIFYHLEFENTSRIPAQALKTRVWFPDVFNVSSLQVHNWYAGGSSCTGTFTPAGDSCIFNFTNNSALIICDTVTVGGIMLPIDSGRCKGYVDFQVNVKPGYNVRNPRNSLKLIRPQVSFDGIWFDLNEFYDLIRIKKAPPFSANLFRPISGVIEDPFDWRCWVLIGLAFLILLFLIFNRKFI